MQETNTTSNGQFELSSQIHGQKWKITNDYRVIDQKIPTFAEIDRQRLDLRKMRIRKGQRIRSNLEDMEATVIFLFFIFSFKSLIPKSNLKFL